MLENTLVNYTAYFKSLSSASALAAPIEEPVIEENTEAVSDSSNVASTN